MGKPVHFWAAIKDCQSASDKSQGLGVEGRSIFVDAMGKLMTTPYRPAPSLNLAGNDLTNDIIHYHRAKGEPMTWARAEAQKLFTTTCGSTSVVYLTSAGSRCLFH
jgi:hypothetical protein